MHHLAIMNPKWKLIDKILKGEKTIESRWYVNRVTPWNKISKGDTVFFKDAGKSVTAKAIVADVIQQELTSIEDAKELVSKYQRELCFTPESLSDFSWLEKKRYAVLIFLKDATTLQSFSINKVGYGNAAAWITVSDIDKLKS